MDNPVDFNGGRTDKDILTWIKKRTGAVTEVLSSSEDIAAFIAKHLVAVVYYGNLNNLFLPKLA